MNHPSPETLDAYRDGALGPAAHTAVEAHLASCAACQTALAELDMVYAELASVPETPPPHDLAPGVLARIGQGRWGLRAWGALLLQAAATLALALLLAPPLLGSLAGLPWPQPDLSPERLLGDLRSLQRTVSDAIAALMAIRTAPILALPPLGWAALLLAGMSTWLAGNRLLLGAWHERPDRQEAP